MKHRALIATLIVSSIPAFAAVTGTVINKTTGKPQAGATVGLNKLDPQLGITLVDQAKSGSDGSFSINQDTAGGVPFLIRTAFDGVTYNHMMPPGSPTSGLTLEVFNASKLPGSAKVSRHMLMFAPSNGQMTVSEIFLLENDGQTAWNDPGNGTLHFYLPAGAGGKATAQVTPPGSMAIGAAVTKTAKSDVFAVDYPVKPGGETRFDLTYTLPFDAAGPYEGKIVTKDENTYLIAAAGMTLTGDGLNDLGQEPKTQDHIYGIAASSYKVQFNGTPVAAAPEVDTSGSPQIEPIMPRLYDKMVPILALTLGILALGFALLYRANGNVPAKESNDRGRG